MGQIITIAQQKGGAGKTTVAVHLGVALAQAGLQVSMLDVDPQGSLLSWFSARQKFSGSETKIAVEAFTDRWGLGHCIDRMADESDLLIIDTPPHTKDQARLCIQEADLVIVPLQPSPTDLWACMNTIHMVNEENTETYVLLNRVVHNTKLASMFQNEIPRRRFETVLANRIGFASSMVEGKGVTESSWASSQAAKEILQVTAEVAQLMPEVIQNQKLCKA